MSHLFPLQESYAYRAWFVPPAEHRWVIPTDASNLHTTRGGSDGFRPDGVRRHSGPTGLCGAGGGGGWNHAGAGAFAELPGVRRRAPPINGSRARLARRALAMALDWRRALYWRR